MKAAKTRYEKIKKQTIEDMAATFSFYFGCDRCPAKAEGCSENCDMCMDAIKKWLEQEGGF